MALGIPASARKVLDAIRESASALLDVFVESLGQLGERFSGRSGQIAIVEADRIVLHTLSKGRIGKTLHLAQNEKAPGAFRSGFLQLRLPADLFLTRTLRLPDAGRAYLQPIIAHRLERLTPWRTDKVLYGFSVIEGVAEDGTIAVELLATSVDLVAPHLVRLEAAGIVPTALSSMAEPLEAPLRFDLYKGRPDTPDRGLRLRTKQVIAGLSAVLIPACLVSYALAWSADAHLQDAEARLATLRTKLGAREGASTSRERTLIEAKQRETATIALIDGLSRALPDNTVLREIDIDPLRVRLVGRSGDAPALIARLEAEAGLKNLRFAAPVIRDAEKRDAFDLVASRAAPAPVLR